MKIYNADKSKELVNFEYKPEMGMLYDDKLQIGFNPEVPYIPEEGHYETIRTYPGGGGTGIWVVDKPGQEHKDAEPIFEDIKVFVPFTQEQQDDYFRDMRISECFWYINRGELWYKHLSPEQKKELDIWYDKWLHITETRVIPEKPKWLKD